MEIVPIVNTDVHQKAEVVKVRDLDLELPLDHQDSSELLSQKVEKVAEDFRDEHRLRGLELLFPEKVVEKLTSPGKVRDDHILLTVVILQQETVKEDKEEEVERHPLLR